MSIDEIKAILLRTILSKDSTSTDGEAYNNAIDEMASMGIYRLLPHWVEMSPRYMRAQAHLNNILKIEKAIADGLQPSEAVITVSGARTDHPKAS